MTARTVTLAGYAVIAVLAIGFEATARRRKNRATLGHAISVALGHWPWRILLLTGWLWLGWHLFVRTDWR